MGVDHLGEVHAVHVVGADDHDDVRPLVVDDVQALVDGVRAAQVPVLADALLRGHGGHVVAQQRAHPPRLGDVPVEAVGLVLREHDDVQVPRVDDVRQGEVDQAVQAPEGHRRLGSVGSQGHQAFAFPTCEDDSEDARRCHASTLGPRRGPSEARAAHALACREKSRSSVPVGEGMVRVRVDLLTREYPPHVYGGAGVHVVGLTRVLARTIDVRVHCFDGPRDEPGVSGYSVPTDLATANAALQTFGVDLEMADAVGHVGADGVASDLVHSHTWYANLGGHLAGLLHGIPHVVTAHSLEPLRPWKAEQLGGGYALSSWAEKTAYEGAAAVIAVSGGMREDILRSYPSVDPDRVKVVHNGIDLDQWQRPTATRRWPARTRRSARSASTRPGRPSCSSAGSPARRVCPTSCAPSSCCPPDVQVVLCAGAPDTPEILAEVTGLVDELRTRRTGIVWIEQMLPRDELIAVLAHGTVFACPSVYEPLGIVNLEAMAVGLPVVGTATGGIPEVIDDGVTGLLVPIDQLQDGTGTPSTPRRSSQTSGPRSPTPSATRADARSGVSRRGSG